MLQPRCQHVRGSELQHVVWTGWGPKASARGRELTREGKDSCCHDIMFFDSSDSFTHSPLMDDSAVNAGWITSPFAKVPFRGPTSCPIVPTLRQDDQPMIAHSFCTKGRPECVYITRAPLKKNARKELITTLCIASGPWSDSRGADAQMGARLSDL